MSTPKVLIAGAGIGGLSAAIALRTKGIDVEVYEAAPELPASGTGLGLASNATKVLRALGIDFGRDDCGCALEHLELRTARGKMLRALPIQSITAELGHPVISVHRRDLMRVLLDAAGDTPIHYGAQLVDFETDERGVRALCADGRVVRADVLIGADGIQSTTRSKLAGAASPTDCGYVFWLSTVVFAHPRVVTGYAGHYWGRGQRFGLIDIGGGRVYWWGSKNMPVAQAHAWRGRKTEVLAAFDGWSPEIVDVIERTPEHTIVTVPAQDRPFLEQWGSGPVSLLGDAAHPMQTSLGQGASSAVEDAYVLAEAIARVPDPVAALRRYEDCRRARARMLVRSSRRYSRLEQVQNPAVRAARDLGVRCMPTWALKRHNIRPMRFDLAWDAR
ncbi:MAG TPA: NAD(P)/FAD-dependent oxidoreductase [Mycobacterium sp.]|jgi:2-polyprenyl-6-methoxyphenol hydroxylase-like FAD-dependent oxidoreductase|nr:NAD(P)/FAD-dependent oxidoreductase [Mycobacterium sp.]